MRILIVEDDTTKLQRLAAAIAEHPKTSHARVSEVRSSALAKGKLESEYYDVMLLDIHIPRHIEEEPRPFEGVELLRDIRETDYYLAPGHIIGITAKPKVFEQVEKLFDEELFAMVFYSENDDSWKPRLLGKLSYIADTLNDGRSQSSFLYDVGVVTALQKEIKPFMQLRWHWSPITFFGDHLSYWQGSTVSRSGQIKVAAVCAPSMGLSSASIATTRLIERYRPRLLVMGGITAGIRGKVALGDVICADPTWDWGSGKYVRDNGGPKFLPSPYQIGITPDLRSRLGKLQGDVASLATIREEWPNTPPPTPLKLHIGPMASGASVLADTEMAERIRTTHRELLGVEMETYAVYHAAAEAASPRPLAISLKGVCDFADPEKDDEFQGYAAYTSAQVIKAAVEQYLF
jgi:nucleoside phosphorylase